MLVEKNFLIENNCLREFLIFSKSRVFALFKASFFKSKWLIVFSRLSFKIAMLFNILPCDCSFGLWNIFSNSLNSSSVKKLFIKSKALLSILKAFSSFLLFAGFCCLQAFVVCRLLLFAGFWFSGLARSSSFLSILSLSIAIKFFISLIY